MARCKACGAEILWIKMASGKSMPCDAQKITYTDAWKEGSLTLITPEGKIAKGEFDPGAEKYGYTSHFATCPAANAFRKGKNNAKKDS